MPPIISWNAASRWFMDSCAIRIGWLLASSSSPSLYVFISGMSSSMMNALTFALISPWALSRASSPRVWSMMPPNFMLARVVVDRGSSAVKLRSTR